MLTNMFNVHYYERYVNFADSGYGNSKVCREVSQDQ